jgi:DNA-binding NarL/FixJ family response regulator
MSTPPPTVPIRVAIVEDHPAFAEGLAALLRGDDRLVVVGTARSYAEARRLLASQDIDVVVCDVMLDDRDTGFDLLREFRGRTKLLMLSAFDYQAHHARALDGGAGGYLSKLADIEQITAAIVRIAKGEPAFSSAVLRSARSAPPPPTRRELELLSMLELGATNDELAIALGIRVKSVEGMFRRMFNRYGVANRTQLAGLAGRQGWLTSVTRDTGTPPG